ncbi:Hypothetical protein NTJ_00538 [Nesidiocoris tenuis]|uniref:Uncharacterized protein n=1 Tax=Nesidiocoris tenuis TaxID=355587 RepID=A0ABN7A681_9HEMI|nr:Hypothetical protein NTJ_00538 [Nesidiocoris tenuis]
MEGVVIVAGRQWTALVRYSCGKPLSGRKPRGLRPQQFPTPRPPSLRRALRRPTAPAKWPSASPRLSDRKPSALARSVQPLRDAARLLNWSFS